MLKFMNTFICLLISTTIAFPQGKLNIVFHKYSGLHIDSLSKEITARLSCASERLEIMETQVILQNKNNKTQHKEIFNLHFTPNHFNIKTFNKEDYKYPGTQLRNDLLIVVTLYEAENSQWKKLSKKEVINRHLLSHERLIEIGFKRLGPFLTERKVYPEDTLVNSIISDEFGFIVEDQGKFLEYSGKIRTEFFMMNFRNYSFINQFKFGELNYASSSAMNFSYDEIDSILKKYKKQDLFEDTLSGLLIPFSVTTNNSENGGLFFRSVPYSAYGTLYVESFGLANRSFEEKAPSIIRDKEDLLYDIVSVNSKSHKDFIKDYYIKLPRFTKYMSIE